MSGTYFSIMAVLVLAGFFLGAQRARAMRGGPGQSLHSLPAYHGLLIASAVLTVMMAIFVVVAPLGSHHIVSQGLGSLDPSEIATPLQRDAALRDIQNLIAGTYQGEPGDKLKAAAAAYGAASNLVYWGMNGLGTLSGLAVIFWGLGRITPELRARNQFERFAKYVLLACSGVAVLTTIGIVFSVVFEAARFFSMVSPIDFLFGLQWSPQTAMRADQVGSSGAFGIVPLIAGTLLITLIAMLVAGPLGLFSAIYMAEYATPKIRAVVKPILEILAGIPTVVLGFFAALTVAPLIRGWGQTFGLDVASESALAAGLVMGMMIIPFVSSLSDDVINAVPQSLRDGSYAMGATKSETIKKVVLPAALPGIVSAFMLAISRAVGETMIVVMAAGLAANLTFNPLAAVTTVTVQIKTLLVGDQEFDSAKTLSAFALGLVLFFFTLALNYIALKIVQRYREQYD
ncbi:phosphate ABC transporter permease subunit PstC [Nordella sp. HKS 07]|uniref:phosphate ABC transporter permease subunit PstC n=1 Tax=Nordella sp. HKS 07 TaxID=2712222 RepID=UPI0013E12ED6|nr:phosphate ABC transporter permease subunit PstC [Nordella sp. HKS 07]QIG48948.1 phosphate ABC transporter permease subunit PstC [Nordella sp. HKS 07]